MFSMTWHNILMILLGIKTATLRPISNNFKEGSTQTIKTGMFNPYYYFKVEITKKELININELTPQDFQQLGYASKEEYLQEPFNKKNPSNLRIRYTFKVKPDTIQTELLTGILDVIQ